MSAVLHFVASAGGSHPGRRVQTRLRSLACTFTQFSRLMSVDEKLRVIASAALQNLFTTPKISLPISSFELLTHVIASGPPPAGLFPDSHTNIVLPKFRLTDLACFEAILECFSQGWDHGTIVVSREQGDGLAVMDVRLGAQSTLPDMSSTSLVGRKRKRVVDEDADSASGDAAEEEDGQDDQAYAKPAPTTVASLSKELKDVYAILQKGTAKGRLIAEQVRSTAVQLNT